LLIGFIVDMTSEEAVKRLLKYDKVDVNTKVHKKGSTPLMHAAKKGLPNIVALLLKYGARLSDTNLNGSNAVDIAERALIKLFEQLKQENLTKEEIKQKEAARASHEKVFELLTKLAKESGFVYIPREAQSFDKIN